MVDMIAVVGGMSECATMNYSVWQSKYLLFMSWSWQDFIGKNIMLHCEILTK